MFITSLSTDVYFVEINDYSDVTVLIWYSLLILKWTGVEIISRYLIKITYWVLNSFKFIAVEVRWAYPTHFVFH